MLRCRRGKTRSGSDTVSVVFRPELVLLEPFEGANSLDASVTRVDFTGDHLKAYLETPDGPITAKLAPDHLLTAGSRVRVHIRPENCFVH
jgi:ABC-type sugar transport system ATPase subunit